MSYGVFKLGNESTKVCQITWFLRKTNHKAKCCCVKYRQRVCGCLEKHSTGKRRKNLRTVYSLFDHKNTSLSSDFRRLKTIRATRSVFHLFWRWRPVARAPYQPRNAAVLKHGRPRTSDTAIIIWASRFSYVVLHKSLRRGSPRGVLVPVFPSKIAQCSHVPTRFPYLFPF